MKYPVVCLDRNTSIQKSIQLIERSPFDSAFVLDETGSCLGAVGIADLRRLLISGAHGEEEIGAYPMNHTYRFTEVSLNNRQKADRMISDMQLNGIRFLPILTQDGKINEVLSIEDLVRLHGFSEIDPGPLESARRVLVVGGAGFLGSVLTQKLLSRGFRVRVLDSFIYGRRSLEPLAGDENLEIVEGDLRNIHTCVSSLAETDAVVLLAAIVGDPASKIRPTETIETNVLAAQALASASKLHHINRFLYASTCSVYGIGADLLDENAPLNPVSLYARTKIESEKIILAMGDEYFSPTILRMGTLYGYSPRMRFDLVVNLLTAKALIDSEITIFGGNQWRSFVHVEDAARSIMHVLAAPLEVVRGQEVIVRAHERLEVLPCRARDIEEEAPILRTGLDVPRLDRLGEPVRDQRRDRPQRDLLPSAQPRQRENQ